MCAGRWGSGKYSSDPRRVAAFRKSIGTVAALPCDVMISVHPDFSHVFETLARRAAGEADAFLTPNPCREYAASMREVLERRLHDE